MQENQVNNNLIEVEQEKFIKLEIPSEHYEKLIDNIYLHK